MHVAMTSGPDRSASGGMYAFGDLLSFLFALGAASIPATGLALYFLRPYRLFWKVLAAASLALSATGFAAMILFFAGRTAKAGLLGTLASLSVLRVLSAPPLLPIFVFAGLFAPERAFRLALFGAALLEAAGFAPVALYWVLSQYWRR